MKKVHFNSLLMMAVLFITLIGCKKDDDDSSDNNNNVANQFTYNNGQYQLSEGILENYGSNDNISPNYAYGIVLYSSGISFDNTILEFNGQGHFIYLELITSSESSPEGTYSFDDSPPYNDKNFLGDFGLDYNMGTETGAVVSEIKAGTIKVAKSGSVYEITIDCTDENDKKITGYFKGSLVYYDWSD